MGNAYIVTVDDDVTRATEFTPALGFASGLINAGVLGSDTIRPGDTLGLQIYENVDDGLISTGGAPAILEEIQVDGAGFIFVPYAGRIKASGNSPEAIRRLIARGAALSIGARLTLVVFSAALLAWAVMALLPAFNGPPPDLEPFMPGSRGAAVAVFAAGTGALALLFWGVALLFGRRTG